jgi:Putative bacterial sensory transduction regulator
MRRKERIEVLNGSLTAFVAEPRDEAYMLIENADRPDDFVQFIFHDGGILFGEVGSHGWSDEPDQLPEKACAGLVKLGFTGGGRRRNFRNDGLPHDPQFLAELVEKAFAVAYSPGLKDYVFATTDVRTQAWLQETNTWTRVLGGIDPASRPINVDRGLIKEVLDSHGLHLFADSKGDFMTFWGYEPEVDTEVKIWFKLDGEDEDVYRISATGDRPLPRKAWNQATQLCNAWNSEHRWPKASVLKLKRDDRSVAFVELNADIPVRHGASRRMLDDFTGRVVHGTFEFFRWLHEHRDSRPLPPTEPAADF